MSEIKLQSDIVRKFSELYPNKRGQLFHVPNERNNKIQVFNAKSIGIFPGVSDLIYFDNLGFLAIELKMKGSSHKVDHLKQQLNWAKTWVSMGNSWVLCRSVDEAISCIDEQPFLTSVNGLSITDVELMIVDAGKKKTVKF